VTSLMHGTVRDMRSEEECRPTMSFEQHALTDESETLCALKPRGQTRLAVTDGYAGCFRVSYQVASPRLWKPGCGQRKDPGQRSRTKIAVIGRLVCLVSIKPDRASCRIWRRLVRACQVRQGPCLNNHSIRGFPRATVAQEIPAYPLSGAVSVALSHPWSSPGTTEIALLASASCSV